MTEYIAKLLSAIQQTSNTEQKKKYFLDIPYIVESLSDNIHQKTYQPSIFTCFVVKDPKIREIFAPHFRDRVIHHFLINKIDHQIDKRFIDTSFANRKNKGTHKAITSLKKALRKQNSNFFLQIDVQNFFPSIDKIILFSIFNKHLDTLNISIEEKHLSRFLAESIIFHNPTTPLPIFTGDNRLFKLIPTHKSLFNSLPNNGLPIGSLSSQFFANLYMNELDQYAKHILKIKYYFRYADDIIILEKNTKILIEHKEKIEIFLKNKLKLNLHPKKTIMQPTKHGINFLGYITRSNYILVRKRTVKSFKKRLYFFNYLFDPASFPHDNAPQNMKIFQKYQNENRQPPIEPEMSTLLSMLAVINSYYGIFKFADSYKLRKDLYENNFKKLKDFFEPTNDQYIIIRIKSSAKETGMKPVSFEDNMTQRTQRT